jgi:hypothetical protein
MTNTQLTRRSAMTGAASLALGLTSSAHAQTAQPSQRRTVTGIVYESSTGGPRQAGEQALPGVQVSNGRDIVTTDAQGRYSLAIDDEAVVFVIKPSGYRTPVDPVTKLPRFSYVHQANGSPTSLKLRFRGIDPTGELPASVDFPLIRQPESTKFDVILFTDPQPESQAELDFVRDDAVVPLIGSSAAFGVTTGDILFDDLAMYGRHNRVIGQIGIPWWNIGGNHDLNFEAPDRNYSRETFKRVFGAPHYAFNYANALFIMLDNVAYLGPDTSRPSSGGKYKGEIGERQLAFMANLLKETPQDKLIVICMHIPLRTYLDPEAPAVNTSDRADFLRLIAGRPAVSFSGHTHTTEHHYLDVDGGQHHHHVLTAVSGSWWSGPFDHRGIACAMSRDGSPNGYHILSVDGAKYETRFVPAKEPGARRTRILLDSVFHRAGRELQRDFRMGQMLGSPISDDALHATEVIVNVFDGGPRTKVELAVGHAQPFPMMPERRPDPLVQELFARNEGTKKPWVKAEVSSHIWTARLPHDLKPGAHTLTVLVRDEYGRSYSEHAVMEVTSG